MRPQSDAVNRIREGLAWVFGTRILRWLAFVGFCCNFSMITVWTMFLLYGTRDLHLAASTLGAIFATASFFTTYLGLGIANVVIVSLRQAATPQALLSRMTACFRMLLFGGGALGGLTAGLLSGASGDRDALMVAAVFSAAVIVALALSPVSRLRELPV